MRWWLWWWLWWCLWWSCFCSGAVDAMQCAQRREISPCTCHKGETGLLVVCERVDSYASIARALRDRFPQPTHAVLTITHTDLRDLVAPTLADLGLRVVQLNLNFDNISNLDDSAFIGLETTSYLSLADNDFSSVPWHILRHMPYIRTLDLGRCKIKNLLAEDFKDIPDLNYLVMVDNGMETIEKGSFPNNIRHLQIGSNNLTTLNGTIKHLGQLEWLIFNSNKLTTLENELPMNANMMWMIQAAHNQLEAIPKEIRNMPMINNLFFYDNNIQSLDGTLQKARRLETLNLSFNKIKYLSHDEFSETKNLRRLDLSYNQIQYLNGSLQNITLLKYLNLTHNELVEFSIYELRSVKELWVADLSHNQIVYLKNCENTGNFNASILELRLSYNKLRSLNGALKGLLGLIKLNVSHNQLDVLTAEDLKGLDQLRVLDISHNHIKTLEKMAKISLPAIEEFYASYNDITKLDKDFHVLSSLCHADFSYNNIELINIEIVLKTKCSIHGVAGTLKVLLHGNPVLCDENYPELKYVKSPVRFYGECARPFTPTVVAKSLLNDIVPISGGIMLSSNVVSLDDSMKTKVIGVGSKLVHIITGKNGELPIIVYPPMTLPATQITPTTPSSGNQQWYSADEHHKLV